MEIERIDYGDAVKQLSEDYRIDLTEFETKRQSSPEYKSDKEKTKRMMKLAQEYFVSSLHNTSWMWALSYLTEKRKLSDQMIVQLWLGYAPSQSQSFFSYFQKQWFSLEDLMQVWLAKQWTGEIYAFFRDRLIVPIKDQLGNVIAFGARALHDGQEPKYLNSSESMIYDKSSTLYGIDHLKKWVKDHKAIIVVEGYFDVIALQQAGLEIGVATCGTSLTANHMTMMKRYSDQVYFLFDNDSAGMMATLRGLAIAYAQGLYPKIIDLKTMAISNKLQATETWSQYKDIDELVRDNSDAQSQVKLLMESAKDGFVRALDYYIHQYDSGSPVERQKILYGLFDLVYAVDSLSTQNLFLEQIAQSLHMDYTLISAQYRQYIKTEKKLFWPRKQVVSPGVQEKIIQERTDQKMLILSSLLWEDFWKSLGIDKIRIQQVQDFLTIAGVSVWEQSLQSQYTERQLRREKELASFVGEPTLFAKQVIIPYLHTIQKNALKHLSAEQKQQLLQLSGKLR